MLVIVVAAFAGCEVVPASVTPPRDDPRAPAIAPPSELAPIATGLPDIRCPPTRRLSITGFLLAPLFGIPEAEAGMRIEYPPNRLVWLIGALLDHRHDGDGQCVLRTELSP